MNVAAGSGVAQEPPDHDRATASTGKATATAEHEKLAKAVRQLGHSDPAQRLAAARTLVAHGAVNTVEPALAELSRIESHSREAEMLMSACRYIRRVLNETEMRDTTGNVALSQEAEREILAGRSFDDFYLLPNKNESPNLLIVFTGMAQSFGVSLALLLRILKRFDCHVVFLQDRLQQNYVNGVVGLGGTYPATLERLKATAEELGASNIFCLGQSAGGYGAIQFAIGLQARGVLAFAPATTLEPLLERGDIIYRETDRCAPRRPLDLTVQIKRAKQLPHISIVFGAEAQSDAEQALRLQNRAVEHIPVEGYAKHTVFSKVIADDRLDGMIEQLMASSPHRRGWRWLPW